MRGVGPHEPGAAMSVAELLRWQWNGRGAGLVG